MTSATHYAITLGRFGEVEIVGERGGGKRQVRWPDGSTSIVHLSKLRPLERPAPSPGAIVRPYTVAGEHTAVRAVPKDPPVRSRSYLAWIRKQPCAWTLEGHRPREASHHPEPMHGSKGVKCSDLRTLPLLPEVHRQFTDTQAIGDMTPERTRAWVEGQIAEHQARYLRDVLGCESIDVDRARTRALRQLIVETLERQQRRVG